MANTNQATPIWLDMRTEYIDANFDKFVDYLYKNRNQQSDLFYKTSMDLLRRRVAELVSELSSESLTTWDKSEIPQGQKQKLLFEIKLFSVYILSETNSEEGLRRTAFLYQLLLLMRVCSNDNIDELGALAISLIVGDGRFVPGYTWNDVLGFYPDIITEKILKYHKLNDDVFGERWFEGKGCARTKNGSLQFINQFASEGMESFQVSLSLLDGKLNVVSPQKDKLKQSQQNDTTAIVSFVNDYLSDMKDAKLRTGERKLKKYHPDSELTVEVRVTNVSDRINAITIDKDYEPLSGTISFNSTLCFTMQDLIKNWEKGYEIPVRITNINKNHVAVFDIREELIKYIVEEKASVGDIANGMAVKIINGQHTMWLTDLGFPVYTQFQQFEIGSTAELSISQISENGYIKAKYVDKLDKKYVDVDLAKKDLILSFCFEGSEDDNKEYVDDVNMMDQAELKAIIQLLFALQRIESKPVDRCKILGTIMIACKMVGDEDNLEFVSFLTKYLNNLVHFAQGRVSKMKGITISEALSEDESVRKRTQMLSVLQCYGDENDSEQLTQAIQSEDCQISKIAQLVQSCNRFQKVLSSPMQNAIKFEILKMLRLNDGTDTDLEEASGVYLGIENGHQEFKTSIVYPPDNQMQPDLNLQKFNVFKAVCAFLNSESGGVVYLGVNDLGTISGLDNDLAYFKKGLDGYMRYITDELINSFGQSIALSIEIHPMYDERVVAINIKPCDYKIVELDGKAYIRINAESREMNKMTKSIRNKMLEKSRRNFKGVLESQLALETAISNRKQVILHGYSSSHSGVKKDRNVEPFALSTGKTHVWCYDIDDGAVKVFALTRIGNVEILEKEWIAEKLHKEGKMDIFHMISDNSQNMTLELDRMAYNLIIEEYPESRRSLLETPNGTWILNTEICDVCGIGRFYVGLADHITIIDAPELEKYAKDYFEKQINRINKYYDSVN